MRPQSTHHRHFSTKKEQLKEILHQSDVRHHNTKTLLRRFSEISPSANSALGRTAR